VEKEREPIPERCPQCDLELKPDFSYCPNCGQKRIKRKEKIGDIVQNFLGDYLAFDSKLSLSLRPLLFKPGFLTREYLKGKRTKYITPLRLYIFISLIFFLILNWQYRDTPTMEARFWDDFFGNYLPKIFFLFLPLFALYVGLVFRKRHSGYVSNLILSLHFHAFAFLILILYLIVSKVLYALGLVYINFGLLGFNFIWMAIYLFQSFSRVMELPKRKVLFRYLVFLIIYSASVLLVLFGILALATLRSQVL